MAEIDLTAGPGWTKWEKAREPATKASRLHPGMLSLIYSVYLDLSVNANHLFVMQRWLRRGNSGSLQVNLTLAGGVKQTRAVSLQYVEHKQRW